MKRTDKDNRYITIDLPADSESSSLTTLPGDIKRMLKVQWREFVHELEDAEEWNGGRRRAKRGAPPRYTDAA